MARLEAQALVRATFVVWKCPLVPVIARCMDQRFPMRRSINFIDMRRKVGGGEDGEKLVLAL